MNADEWIDDAAKRIQTLEETIEDLREMLKKERKKKKRWKRKWLELRVQFNALQEMYGVKILKIKDKNYEEFNTIL